MVRRTILKKNLSLRTIDVRSDQLKYREKNIFVQNQGMTKKLSSSARPATQWLKALNR
jgi:hypothetical protein